MKPFLGIDLTTDKENERPNGEVFLTQTTSPALAQALQSSSDRATATIQLAKLPMLLRIIEYVCGFAALLFVGGIFKADVSLAEGYRNAPWVYWTAGVCGAVWLILWLWGKIRAKNTLDTEESTQTFSNLDGVMDAILTELTVPADAKEIDILSFFYKEKDGQITAQEKGLQLAPYFNPIFRIFADTENLYVANLEGKYTIPRSSLTAIRTVKKHIRITEWNKEEAFNKGIYKQYKLTSDNYDCIHCKYYHILEFADGGEIWGIYFPCYELPAFESVTGLKA